MHSNKVRLALAAILEHGSEVESFLIGVSQEQFRNDRQKFHAVVRCLEVISEASRRLSVEIRERHPTLPWRGIADAGNLYRHEYENVEVDFIYRTATTDLLDLLSAVRQELDGD